MAAALPSSSLGRGLALTLLLMSSTGCWSNPFTNVPPRPERPGDPEEEARKPIAPPQPAVQAAGADDDGQAGFDIRLVRVQPGVHIDTEQPCDIVFQGRPQAVEADTADRYPIPVRQRMSIKCHAPTGEGWADLIFPEEQLSFLGEVRRGRRVLVRILTADGGYFDYPIVEFLRIEGSPSALSQVAPRPEPVTLPNGFDLRRLRDNPSLVGTVQRCSVAFVDEIDVVRPSDVGRRSYPAGIQNRMTVRCRHSAGEEPADLVFMPASALAALEVRRGSVIPVRVISRTGGFVDYPILQYTAP
jgi:hypothetical protein